MADTGIDEMQYRYIREKLARYGLLDSKNEANRAKNFDAVQHAVEDVVKQLTSKKPKVVKKPKFQKISTADSYRITTLGRQYIELIFEPVE